MPRCLRIRDREIRVFAAVVSFFGVSVVLGFAAAKGPTRLTQHLIEVALDLFPEIESQRVHPSPNPGEPAAVLTARIRPEVATKRVRQASERARTFAGGAVAGTVVVDDNGIRLAVRAASGHDLGTLFVVGVKREVRIEIWPAEGAVSPVEALPPLPVAPQPVMRLFPLED